MSVQATKWGCPAATFDYTRQHYDTTFQVRLNAINLPLPITVTGWQLEIGNFSYNLGIRDPRPNWSGAPVPITAPTATLTGGHVWRPEPPLSGFFEPQEVTINVTGSAETGWILQFSGLDSYFYVRVAVTVIDGDDNQQAAATFLVVDGDDITFGDDYGAWKDDCNRKYRAYLATLHLVQEAQVLPGEAVQNIETLVAMVIREAIRVGNPGAYSQLAAAVQQYGEQILGRIGTAPTLPTAALPKSE